jgi:hypothetical protein
MKKGAPHFTVSAATAKFIGNYEDSFFHLKSLTNPLCMKCAVQGYAGPV